MIYCTIKTRPKSGTLQGDTSSHTHTLYLVNKWKRGGEDEEKVGGRDDGGTKRKRGEVLLCRMMME